MRSTAFEERSGIRVGGVDSFFSTLIDLPTAFWTSGLTSISTRSIEKPTHSLFLLTYAKGGEPVRVPIVKTPVSLIFASVSCWALSGSASDRPGATATTTQSMRFSTRLRLVGEDLPQKCLGAVRPA